MEYDEITIDPSASWQLVEKPQLMNEKEEDGERKEGKGKGGREGGRACTLHAGTCKVRNNRWPMVHFS